MEFKDSRPSLGRLVLDFFGRLRARRYAIEVDADYVETFEVPGTKIFDSWENGDGSVVFVVQSRWDVRPLAENIKGVRGVSLM